VDQTEYILNAVDGNVDGKDWMYPETATSSRSKSSIPTSAREAFSRRKFTPRILDQGRLGSCVGQSGRVVFGGTPRNRPFDLSPMWIYRVAKMYDRWKGEDYSGSSITGGCKGLKAKGACLEKYWPYVEDETTDPKEGADSDAEVRKIHAYYRVDINKTETIKDLLVNESLWFSFIVYKDFYKTGSDGLVPVENHTKSQKRGGHAVTMIGWKHINGELYWECQNSWSARWGNKGYFFLKDSLLKEILQSGPYYLVTRDEENKRLADERKKLDTYLSEKKSRFPYFIFEWFKKIGNFFKI